MRCFGRRGKFFGARLIGLLVLPSTESGWRRFRDLRWMHGPVVVVDILTRPTLGAPRRALFPGRWRDAMSEGPFNSPSKLARSPFGAGLIGLLLRAWTSTDFLQIRLIWRARSASKGDQQPSPLSLWRARSASKGDQPARTPLHSSFRPCARLGKLPSLNADQRDDAYS